MNLSLADSRPPLPPADLILRVTTRFDSDDIAASKASFDLDSFEHLQGFERALAVTGRCFSDFDRILDFGCGCGRFLRHFGSLAGEVELHGTDIDAEMIAWCSENIPFATFTVGPHEPPTTYPDNYFDLVINHSVFTHLDERFQDLWLTELHRITQPGAYLMLTVEGASSWNRTCEMSERVGDDVEQWREELETRGILFISDDHFVGSTHPDFYHSAVHAAWYVFERWTRWFDLAAYLPDGAWSQDLIVLRRRPDGVPQQRPIGRRLPTRMETSPAPDSAPAAPAPARALLSRVVAALERLTSRRRPPAKPMPPPATVPAPASAPDTSRHNREHAKLTRELNMLRAGLYEQSNRISIVATELRGEIERLKSSKPFEE